MHSESEILEPVEFVDKKNRGGKACVSCGAGADSVMTVAKAERFVCKTAPTRTSFMRPSFVSRGDDSGSATTTIAWVLAALGFFSAAFTPAPIIGIIFIGIGIWIGASGSKEKSEYQTGLRDRESAIQIVMKKMEDVQAFEICVKCEMLQNDVVETQYEYWLRLSRSYPGIDRWDSGDLNYIPLYQYCEYPGTWREWYDQIVSEMPSAR